MTHFAAIVRQLSSEARAVLKGLLLARLYPGGGARLAPQAYPLYLGPGRTFRRYDDPATPRPALIIGGENLAEGFPRFVGKVG